MMYLQSVLLWLLVAYSDAGHSAEVYKWVDKDGNVHYSDSPPSDVITEEIEPPPAPSKDNIDRTQARTDLLIEQQIASADQRAQVREEKRRLQIAEAERIETLCAGATPLDNGNYILHESLLEKIVDGNGKVRQSASKEMFRDIDANCK